MHHPGRLCASDFTHCSELRISINGMPFDHLIYHFVLSYSNWETGSICFAESFESLAEGLQNALFELGGVPQEHRTDRLTAAVPPGTKGPTFTPRYAGLLRHYGLNGQAIRAGEANENGDAEQSHHRFKRALEQALLLRGGRDFASRSEYEAFLRKLFEQLNAGRRLRLAEEVALLRPLPPRRLESYRQIRVRVDSGSTVHIAGNTYSVPARLIGEHVQARIHAEKIELWYAQKLIESMPRLRGRGKHWVQYRHVIDWLVRKPGAFADYRYRAEMFPTSRFRMAFDVLSDERPSRASKEYLRVLHLAAVRGEALVDGVLSKLLDAAVVPGVEEVMGELDRGDTAVSQVSVAVGCVDLSGYDVLLEGKEASDGNGRIKGEGDVGGVLEGVAPAGIPVGLRGTGPSGSAGVVELRTLPAGASLTRVPGAAGPEGAAAVAGFETAVGEELGVFGSEATAGEGGAASEGAAGGVVRGPSGERAGVRSARLGEDAPDVCGGSGIGEDRTEGAVLDDGSSGAGTARGKA